ncbi:MULTISPECIES: adenosylmethionine--8-amino-7-oxononanoate transaminase [Gammaproteobacteria]|uniref:adenosylmethionine--8-amino-7-oxononanoate transaminase n=1 Tax=Gammaproteobacteria TaxID=1236 RepID=UPI000DCFEE9C|nr:MULTISPECIES: adenosylmethionine--8-amino-7-oxononanoate transaminase [Gammaproteobacteria]RTE87268.1 adenosylmethionine--8-amino-7-oxononanoate transaminase [Aliidiomarina sp. B3213]TCZ92945.1 adenosylmethionine--8-amino-7-oxononanoate transaminase [Lysobacter sp. N42]
MVKFQSTEKDLAFDKAHIWHPYTSLHKPLPTYPVVSANGCKLILDDGRELIDGMASWWAAVHGYNHPRLNEAGKQQIDNMAHVMFGGITHPPAVALARQLVEITPEPLQAVFLADSGSISVEVAIKMAIQYQYSRNKPTKNKMLTIKRGYHGDTFAAMSVCDPVNGMHELFTGTLAQHFFAEAPSCGFHDEWNQEDIESLANLLHQNHEFIAAIILEPVVQGAGGMRFYHPQYLKEARKLADQYDVLLITDEIATGFGRTGKLFACEHAGISPDIMCVGKALSGGYLTLAATLTTQHVAHTIGQSKAGALMHGPTFMGNPLACAIANESVAMIRENHWQSQVTHIEQQLRDGLLSLSRYSYVHDVRVLGAIGVVEMTYPVDVAKAQALFVECGVWIRPFGKLIYIMPPYIITGEELDILIGAIRDLCEQAESYILLESS